jgi:putative membrane protein
VQCPALDAYGKALISGAVSGSYVRRDGRSTAKESGMRRDEHHLAKGLVAGVVSGLLGTIMMTEFQNAWSRASKALKDRDASKDEPSESKNRNEQEREDSTMKAARKIAELPGHPLSHEEKKRFGPVVHYSFGALQGGLYGGVKEMTGSSGVVLPALLFGSVLFAAADEIAVPALGLSRKPSEYPLSSHLYGLASHLVYGVSTEVFRRGLRAVF